jgi:hypothetical protein
MGRTVAGLRSLVPRRPRLGLGAWVYVLSAWVHGMCGGRRTNKWAGVVVVVGRRQRVNSSRAWKSGTSAGEEEETRHGGLVHAMRGERDSPLVPFHGQLCYAPVLHIYFRTFRRWLPSSLFDQWIELVDRVFSFPFDNAPDVIVCIQICI